MEKPQPWQGPGRESHPRLMICPRAGCGSAVARAAQAQLHEQLVQARTVEGEGAQAGQLVIGQADRGLAVIVISRTKCFIPAVCAPSSGFAFILICAASEMFSNTLCHSGTGSDLNALSPSMLVHGKPSAQGTSHGEEKKRKKAAGRRI